MFCVDPPVQLISRGVGSTATEWADKKKKKKKACSALFFFFFLLATTIIWLTVLWRDLRHRMLGLLIVLWQKRWCAVKQTAVSNRLWLVRDLYRSCMSSQC